MQMFKSVAYAFIVWVFTSSAYAKDDFTCFAYSEAANDIESTFKPLPIKMGKRTVTSGRVPHVQLDVSPDQEINSTLRKLAFKLPDIESRPTIVSLPGATGMWLSNGVPVVQPKAIVSGREFAHIHTDGSLHIPLPLERAKEMAEKKWGERHPWADRFEGWDGLVMLYSAMSDDELQTVLQLILESYNHVTGRDVRILNVC